MRLKTISMLHTIIYMFVQACVCVCVCVISTQYTAHINMAVKFQGKSRRRMLGWVNST